VIREVKQGLCHVRCYAAAPEGTSLIVWTARLTHALRAAAPRLITRTPSESTQMAPPDSGAFGPFS